MEKGKNIFLVLDSDLDYALTTHLLNLRRSNVKTTKSELIIKLMRIGLLKESRELINEERAEK
jgi:hypothetical protein